MFVITADQVDSRHRADLVDAAIDRIATGWGETLLLPAERTAGDELQLIVASGGPALEIVLELTRHGEWSVGCGIGAVVLPLPKNTRQASGIAFIAARAAVDAAKKRETRFALRAAEPHATAATDLEAVVDLLLIGRGRRSRQGWELYDIMGPGVTQAEAAQKLGITPQAASKRARAAAIRAEHAAVPALGRMLTAMDAVAGKGTTE